MPRQSITFTEPNDDWLAAMVASKEYASKSELVNDLIREARRRSLADHALLERLERSLKSGFSTLDRDVRLAQIKASIKNGD